MVILVSSTRPSIRCSGSGAWPSWTSSRPPGYRRAWGSRAAPPGLPLPDWRTLEDGNPVGECLRKGNDCHVTEGHCKEATQKVRGRAEDTILTRNDDMIDILMLLPIPDGRANREPGFWAAKPAEGGLKPDPAAGRVAAVAAGPP